MAYYVKGMGYFENEPLVTTDNRGERVVQSSGLIRNGTVNADGGLSRAGGDRLHQAYDTVRSDTANALRRWQNAASGSNASERALRSLWQAYRSRGDYYGSYADFRKWFDFRMANLGRGLLSADALANFTGTTTDNRLNSNYQKKVASGAGVNTGVYRPQNGGLSSLA